VATFRVRVLVNGTDYDVLVNDSGPQSVAVIKRRKNGTEYASAIKDGSQIYRKAVRAALDAPATSYRIV